MLRGGLKVARVEWQLLGEHNQMNALAAIGAAEHAGVAPDAAARALGSFRNVRRRLELRGEVGGIAVYDDFAHHPTAMRTTLDGLRRKVGTARILAAFEPRSNTMKLGSMKAQLPWALEEADLAFCHSGGLGWDAAEALRPLGARGRRRRDHRRAGGAHRRRGTPRRPRALHEQRRLRRRARQAAGGAGRRARHRPRRGVSESYRAPAPGAPVTHLLYLHGFRSSPRSTKAMRMQAWVRANRPDLAWLCPQLPPSPRAAIDAVFAATSTGRASAWP